MRQTAGSISTVLRAISPGWEAVSRRAVAIAAIGFAVFAAVSAGCTPHPQKKVTNPDPTGKVPAIKDAVRDHDLTAVGPLVKDLDSEDAAVRFYAIQGLERLTGQTFGYRYYDSEAGRDEAVKRWQAWLAGNVAGKAAP